MEVIAVGATGAFEATPTISISPAYASGDLIGGKISLLRATRGTMGSGIIHSVVLADKGKQSAAVDVVFFASNPSGTTFTDNGALTVADADLLNVVGVVSVTASDYASFADNSVATKLQVGLAFKLDEGETLYACLVSRGAPTYTSTSDLQLRVSILQD